MLWNIQSKKIPRNEQELLDVLLLNRSIKGTKKNLFLSPKHPNTIAPEDVGIDTKQLKAAVKRIAQAKKTGEDVLVFGDYDVDGVSATAILWEALHLFGVKVRPFIPHRERHGYGLSQHALDEILQKPPKLLITVDNGIVAHDAFAQLKKHSIDTILTDHHLTEKKLPPADIIIHTTQLCGATVAWMLANAVNPEAAEHSLDLCGLATIADQVPLTGANRSFAAFGIEALKKTQRPGLLELFHIGNVDQSQIDTYTINYAIGPRINAMGRMQDALDALRLLCTHSPIKAQQLAEMTHSTNLQRQTLTQSLIDRARKDAAQWKDKRIIIVSGKEYHDGVIGLVAGKLMEEFNKPAIVIHENDMVAKASARSIPGVNIIELIRMVKEELLEVGGHPMAAGFSLLPERIESMKKKLEKFAENLIPATALVQALRVECELPHVLATIETVHAIEQLEPFGIGNPRPLFAIKNCVVLSASVVGQQQQHLKLTLQVGKITLQVIGFNMGKRLSELQDHIQLDVAGTLQLNIWREKTTIQLQLKDITLSESSAS